MSVQSFRCLVISHYDGSTIEAYQIFKGDNFRLQLKKQGEFWKWKFSQYKDDLHYLSRESALMACTGFLFRRTLQLSVEIQKQNWASVIHSPSPQLPGDNMLPRRFKSIDSIELGQTSLGFIDILQSEDRFYAFYGDSTFSGPYVSKDECLKQIIINISDRLDDFVKSIFRISTIIHCLQI